MCVYICIFGDVQISTSHITPTLIVIRALIVSYNHRTFTVPRSTNIPENWMAKYSNTLYNLSHSMVHRLQIQLLDPATTLATVQAQLQLQHHLPFFNCFSVGHTTPNQDSPYPPQSPAPP